MFHCSLVIILFISLCSLTPPGLNLRISTSYSTFISGFHLSVVCTQRETLVDYKHRSDHHTYTVDWSICYSCYSDPSKVTGRKLIWVWEEEEKKKDSPQDKISLVSTLQFCFMFPKLSYLLVPRLFYMEICLERSSLI